MRPKTHLIFFVLLISFISTASATNVTFADLNIVKGVGILVYNSTGTLIGEYNSTATASLDSTSDYVFVLKPTEQSWFSDPLNAINLFTVLLPPMMSYLLWVVVIVGTVYIVTRLWK